VTPQPIPKDKGWMPAPAWVGSGRFWLAWPKATNDKDHDDAAREDCLGLAELLSDYAPVSLICPSRDVAVVALRTPPNVAAFAAEHDGSALGLHAPLWLVDEAGRLAAAAARTALGREIAERAGVEVLDAPPGLPQDIRADGEGTYLAWPAGGEGEKVLRDWLGLDRVVWLEPPGAAFLAPGLVVLSPHPANHQSLEAVIDAKGRRLTLIELANPKKGDFCYADCVIAGEAVVVPDFEDGRGTENFGHISAALPGRSVAAFPASWLAPENAGLGAAVVVQPAST